MTAPKTAARRAAELSALLVPLLAGGCAHNSRIITVPEGAAVYVNGKRQGNAPLVYEERSGAPGRTVELKAEMPGRPPVVRKEDVRICPTPGNLILDSFFVGYLLGYCLRDEYVLDFTQDPKLAEAEAKAQKALPKRSFLSLAAALRADRASYEEKYQSQRTSVIGQWQVPALLVEGSWRRAESAEAEAWDLGLSLRFGITSAVAGVSFPLTWGAEARAVYRRPGGLSPLLALGPETFHFATPNQYGSSSSAAPTFGVRSASVFWAGLGGIVRIQPSGKSWIDLMPRLYRSLSASSVVSTAEGRFSHAGWKGAFSAYGGMGGRLFLNLDLSYTYLDGDLALNGSTMAAGVGWRLL